MKIREEEYTTDVPEASVPSLIHFGLTNCAHEDPSLRVSGSLMGSGWTLTLGLHRII